MQEGATILVGGAEPPDGLDKGFYVRPTLFTDVDNSMSIAQEEIFGPVLAVIPYDDEDDASRRLRAGFIGMNGTAGYGADTPFGGYSNSGVGRQNGTFGFDQYTEVKSVAYPAV